MNIKGNLVDIHTESIYPAVVTVHEGEIKEIVKVDDRFSNFILPGLVDSHIHIESSLLLPKKFAEIAISHGTVATVSDPHEIANVCGIDGINFMIENGKECGLKFFWTAPSCVPATEYETSGAIINSEDLKVILAKPEIVALGEMMNYPGVVSSQEEVIKKLEIAKNFGKVIDGHAPALTGEDLKRYVFAGISTDHECATLDEALKKIELGMKILIREGSSAKNFSALYSLLTSYPENVMLCSDDLHADDLIEGHLDVLIKRALALNVPLFNVLKAVSFNPVFHYNLPVGLLRKGDLADFIIVNNLDDFTIEETWVEGKQVYKKGIIKPPSKSDSQYINKFISDPVMGSDLKIEAIGGKVKVIQVEEGQLVTKQIELIINDEFEAVLLANSVLKLYVKDRYLNSNLGKALVMGFGSLKGAIASTIAHDSHNIIAVGDNYSDIAEAINLLVHSKGGIAFVNRNNNIQEFLPLPVAGLMSDKPAADVAHQYNQIIKAAQRFGCTLNSPLMTLSFLALLVIPSLKLSDKGLFNVDSFSFTNMFYQ